MRRLLIAVLVAGTVACSDDPIVTTCPAPSGRLVVTADWLNRSLTLFDEARLVAAACAEPRVGRVDLAEHAPGPLELEITPDGTRAVVAIGPGFLPGTVISADQVPQGGSIVIVDLATQSVVHAIPMQQPPMGLAISPDGRWAYSANYGDASVFGNSLTVIDLDAGSVAATYTVGARPEQVALNSAGNVGIVNVAGDNTIRMFDVDADAVSLHEPIAVGADPSDVAFVAANRAVVTNSLAWSYSLIDTSDSASASVVGEHATSTGVPFGVTAFAGSQEVVVTTFLARATLLHLDVSNDPPVELAQVSVEGAAFTLGATVGSNGYAYVPQPNDQRLSIVDLANQTSRSIQWLDQPGPTYVAVTP